MRPIMGTTRTLALGLALAIAGVAGAANPPLRRNLPAYFILAMKTARLKNMALDGACNVGVNCAKPNASSDCGTLRFEDPLFADGSQIAGDETTFTKAGEIWQLFRNNFNSPLNGTIINLPDAMGNPDGSSPLTPLPIIANLDGDGNESCAAGCVPDYDDIEKGCGFPDPFPACAPAQLITAPANADCVGVADSNPGNARCDLPPGVYGDLKVNQFGKVTFDGGAYVFCSVSVARNASVIAAAPSTIDIPSPGTIQISNESTFGQQCGDFAVRLKGTGIVTFGRFASIAMNLCAPRSEVNLGHGNDLTGQFIGDVVESNSDNRGHCCAGGVCACFDSFAPTTAGVGSDVKLSSACDLTPTTEVKVCGVSATIVNKSIAELTFTVPAVQPGPCPIQIISPAGAYTANQQLTVN